MFSRKIKLSIIGLALFCLSPGKGLSQDCFATTDLDGDGFVGLGDLSLFLDPSVEAYRFDVNGDCVIDQADLDLYIFCGTINLPGVCQQFPIAVCCDPVINFPPPCCEGVTGNVDNDPDAKVDISDLTFLIDHLFIDFPAIACFEEGNIDGDSLGTVDIADLTHLIDHLYISFPPTKPCR